MKYLSILAIVVFLTLSFWVFQRDKELTVSQQNRILNVIEEYMTQKVLDKEPNAAEIEFSNLQTETITKGEKLKAHFKFSYLQTTPEGTQNRVFRKGHFLVLSENGNDWKAKINDINDVQVEFIDPLPIEGDLSNPVKDESDGDASTPAPAEGGADSEANS